MDLSPSRRNSLPWWAAASNAQKSQLHASIYMYMDWTCHTTSMSATEPYVCLHGDLDSSLWWQRIIEWMQGKFDKSNQLHRGEEWQSSRWKKSRMQGKPNADSPHHPFYVFLCATPPARPSFQTGTVSDTRQTDWSGKPMATKVLYVFKKCTLFTKMVTTVTLHDT